MKARVILLLIFTFLFIISCEKQEASQYIEPEIFVSTAYQKANGSIEVYCETINPSSVTKEEFGICWSENPSPTIQDNYQYSGNNSKEEGPFNEQITTIKPNTKYYIRGYMRIAGNDVYSKDYLYQPNFAKGWTRLEDVARIKGMLNFPFAFLQNNTTPTFQRKMAGFEETYEFTYDEAGRFWKSIDLNIFKKTIYEQFSADIEYGDGKFDYIFGGGYEISNIGNGVKKFSKKAFTNTYSTIDNYPGADVPAVGFGAGNKAFVIEIQPNADMFSFNEEDFLWAKMQKPPFANFTNIKATRAGKNGLIILENALKTDSKHEVYLYEFAKDSWLKLNDFPGQSRVGGVLFSIKNKVYFGLGESKTNEIGLKDIWELDLDTMKWVQIANYPGAGSSNIAYVKKGNSVFIGMGYSSLPTEIGTSRKFMAYDFWEFKP